MATEPNSAPDVPAEIPAFREISLTRRCEVQVLREEDLVEIDPTVGAVSDSEEVNTEHQTSGGADGDDDDSDDIINLAMLSSSTEPTSLRDAPSGGHNDFDDDFATFSSDSEDHTAYGATSAERQRTARSTRAVAAATIDARAVSARAVSARAVDNVVELNGSRRTELENRMAVEGGSNDFDVFVSPRRTQASPNAISIDADHRDAVNLAGTEDAQHTPDAHGVLYIESVRQELFDASEHSRTESQSAATTTTTTRLPLAAGRTATELRSGDIPLPTIQSESVQADMRAGFMAFLQQYSSP